MPPEWRPNFSAELLEHTGAVIVLNAYGNLLPEKREFAISASQKNRAFARTEKGCLEFDFFFGDDDPNSFVFVEEWSTKGDLDNHFAHPNFGEFMIALQECLTGPPDIRIFEATSLEG